jgi:hypothetical protein
MRTRQMTFMCIVSGFIGAFIAMACGATDGGKDVYADDDIVDDGDGDITPIDDVILTKSVYEPDCADAEEYTIDYDGTTITGYRVNIGRTVSTNASVTNWVSTDGGSYSTTALGISEDGSLFCSDTYHYKYKVVIIE